MCTDGNVIGRDSLHHLVILLLSLTIYLFQITAASNCVWVKLYCTRSLRISSDYFCSPFCSHLLLQSCLIFSWRQIVSVSGLSHRGATDQLKVKNPLIEYWSGIVRQAEMTKFTHGNKAGACCAFSAVINSAGQRDVSISQELHGLVITALRCGHQPCQQHMRCGSNSNGIVKSSISYHMLHITFKQRNLCFIWHFTTE